MRWLRMSPIDKRQAMTHVMAAPVVGEGILERLLAHDSTDTSGQAVKRVVATSGSARSDASAPFGAVLLLLVSSYFLMALESVSSSLTVIKG